MISKASEIGKLDIVSPWYTVLVACNVNVNVVYSGHALSFEIASLGMPLKHRKQITLNEHNMVKNPNW